MGKRISLLWLGISALLMAAAPDHATGQDVGIDLEMIMEPAPAGAEQDAVENPLDQEFQSAVDAYMNGEYETARSSWSELSDAGHGLSTHNLAVLLWRGQGGPKDREQAMSLFQQAGLEDVAPSLHALGVVHLKGLFDKTNPVEAVRLFEAASAIGHTPSTYNLALAHLKNIGGASDKALGMELLEVAAEEDLPQAQYDLATLLYQGTYGPKDNEAARQWFVRAAESGDPFAHYNLALMQLAGEGGDVDVSSAYENLNVAAELGAVPAQMRLAYMLSTGENGSPSELETAFMWYWVAGGLGADGAYKNADRLAVQMPKEDIERAKRKAARFRPIGSLRPDETINPPN